LAVKKYMVAINLSEGMMSLIELFEKRKLA